MPRKASTPSEATKSGRAAKPVVPQTAPSLDEAIRRRAYELHLERGGAHGAELDDWLRAEREVYTQHQAATAGKKTTKKKA